MARVRAVFVLLVLALAEINGKDWWETGNFYQIYPRSFMDSDGDGIGDLRGILSKIDYVKSLGMSATWLSPIFQSPMADFGYDISDYYNIATEYGTLADFEALTKKCNEVGLKLILDFVPNHTSDEHEWFKKSVKKDPEYKDYYIWHPGRKNAAGERIPPNNWVSVFRFSAWKWNEERQEYYLHQFADQQPDLNYRNPKVVEAMKAIIRFWLDRGVGGFRVDAVPFLFEVIPNADGNYPDESVSGACDDPDSYCYLTHSLTQDLDETFDMVEQWRAVLDDYKVKHGGDTRIMLTEAYTTLENTMRYYGTAKKPGSQIPFNFELISKANGESTAKDFKAIIDSWMTLMPKGYTANWVMGNHDNKRLASRYGVHRADLLNILIQTLPGVAVTYNGEELALTDVHLTWEQTVDPAACNTNQTVYHTYSRDPARTPFQWDDSVSGGFSTNTSTWLPIGDDYKTVNVKRELQTPFSHLKIFKRLVRLRQMASLADGTFESHLIGDNVLVYKRQAATNAPVVVALNFGSVGVTVNLKSVYPKIADTMSLGAVSLQSRYADSDEIDTKKLELGAGVGAVLV